VSLTASEQRALARIEHALRSRDPLLESLFATFTSLTWREALPAREQVQRRGWRPRMIAVVPLTFVLVAAIIAVGSLGARGLSGGAAPLRLAHSVSRASRRGALEAPPSLVARSFVARSSVQAAPRPADALTGAQDDHGTAGDRERRRAVHGPALPAGGGGRVGVEDQLP
jgi:DUF3040 family protein